MRILLVSHHYEPEIGAPQRRWSAFVRRFVEAGHQVTVLTPQPHYPFGRRLPGPRVPTWRAVPGRYGETVVRLPYLPYGPGAGRRLLDQLVTAAASVLPGPGRRADVVVGTVPALPTLAAGHVLARAVRAPFILEMRDAWPDVIGESGVATGRMGRAVSALVSAGQRRADLVVTTSSRFTDVLTGRGVPRVVTVRNGVHTSAVPRSPVPPAQRDRLEVLYLGTVGRSQGLVGAVEAAAGLGDRVRLTVVGEGADRAEVAAAAERFGAPVRLLPPAFGPALWEAYAAADTCLVSLQDWPSFRFTVPSKTYELLATQRHISAAVAGETAEIITATGGGDVVPPEDPAALAALWDRLSRDRSRLDVGPAPREWVARNADLDSLADSYLDLLATVVRPRAVR
ncbi:MAG: glycosyltransferase WbuB [Mycobacterium sp.]|nr:glycosyltransferase WbuB [Mycobacterium sp.]